jgi:hypothetical protein
VKTCPETGKRSYGSKHSARKANASNHKRLRVYLCEFCREYHVTAGKTENWREKNVRNEER